MDRDRRQAVREAVEATRQAIEAARAEVVKLSHQLDTEEDDEHPHPRP